MANKKKRSRAKAREEESAVLHVQAKQTSKKKLKLVKTLSSDAKASVAPATDAQVEGNNTPRTETVSALKGMKKKKKKSPGASIAAANVIAATDKKKKAKGSEIDDLFASLKTTKQKKNIDKEQQKLAQEEDERREKKEKEQLQQQIKKLEAQNTNSSAAGLNPDPRPVRYDEDGLPIYTEASLQINKGGNTKDCPFDCWCCF